MTLEGTLEADVSTADGESRPESVAFAFTVTNAGAEPVELQFSDMCKAEFVVRDGDREVWRFTEGRMFAQMLSREALPPGASSTYEGEWERPRPGAYTASAELRAQEASCEAHTSLTVPE
ncbi:hypothetical protein HTZ84_11740 [Haloterrigena sp. SYSU A558-1]|uniref:Intracellular proteinase inhibitor BsuPI domain-containing protein n=1 Tax=Haloterrigena gelatinilytica TaxID=2741724 RepID=A0A8J8GMS1_9EURY|nr:BsuPI-related putative proteinase inhibitor [Haloterrigena gelatinilytica]NUB91284.1 hypothetical protein [Haloterrigena gelatinilytica]NUC72973.1 hypothetical protein [Haloterrigena gelatinilytica]